MNANTYCAIKRVLCYHMSMNIRERKVLIWRFISAFLLLLVAGLGGYSLYRVIVLAPEGIILDSIAIGLAIFFILAEIVITLRGWKKESHLLDIFINTNGKVNHVFLVAAIIGTIFGLGLDILGLVVLLVRENSVTGTCALHVITTIASFLLANCIMYYIFIFLFRKKKLTLKDYAKL